MITLSTIGRAVMSYTSARACVRACTSVCVFGGRGVRAHTHTRHALLHGAWRPHAWRTACCRTRSSPTPLPPSPPHAPPPRDTRTRLRDGLVHDGVEGERLGRLARVSLGVVEHHRAGLAVHLNDLEAAIRPLLAVQRPAADDDFNAFATRRLTHVACVPSATWLLLFARACVCVSCAD